MDILETARERVEQAADLEDVLNASYRAFMVLLDVVREKQDRGGPLFAAFVAAGVSVAGGRFALAAAPSLTATARIAPAAGPAHAASSAEETTAAIAALCRVVVRRLDDVALIARDIRDRQACQEGSRHARDLFARLGGAP